MRLLLLLVVVGLASCLHAGQLPPGPPPEYEDSPEPRGVVTAQGPDGGVLPPVVAPPSR